MTKVLEGSLPRLGVKVNSINQRAVNVENYRCDRQLLAPILSSKTLIYIAAKLAVEMFFLPMGIATVEAGGKCPQKQLEILLSKVLIRSFVAERACPLPFNLYPLLHMYCLCPPQVPVRRRLGWSVEFKFQQHDIQIATPQIPTPNLCPVSRSASRC